VRPSPSAIFFLVFGLGSLNYLLCVDFNFWGLARGFLLSVGGG